MWFGRVLGGLDGAQSPVFIVTLQSPLCVSFKPLGMTHLWQCYITHHALRAPAAPPWKTAHSWLILLLLWQRKHTSDQQEVFHSPRSVTAQLMTSPRRRGVPLVSGQCHGFHVHKEDVSTRCRVTTDNLLFRSVFYGAPVMLKPELHRACRVLAHRNGMARNDMTHSMLHTI